MVAIDDPQHWATPGRRTLMPSRNVTMLAARLARRPRAAPARCTTDNSGSLRAAQLLEAQDQMTMEELHDVSAV